MALFEATILLNVDAHKVCDFLLKPQNVVEISPPDMSLRFLDAPQVVEIGSRIEFEVSSLGIKQRAIHEITHLEYPHRFVERQLEGPLGNWLHEHRFDPLDTGGVQVIDAIEFDPPGGLAGFVMTEARILTQLEKAFAYRHKMLQELLERRITEGGS